jgi:hypothetical protein
MLLQLSLSKCRSPMCFVPSAYNNCLAEKVLTATVQGRDPKKTRKYACCIHYLFEASVPSTEHLNLNVGYVLGCSFHLHMSPSHLLVLINGKIWINNTVWKRWEMSFFVWKKSIYNNQNRSAYASLRSRTQLLIDFLVIDEMAIPDQPIKIVE